MSSFQQYMSVKTAIVNEIIQKLSEKELLTKELATFLEIELSEGVEKRYKRHDTPRQRRVKRCLLVLKKRFTIRERMAAAQFVAFRC